MAVSYGFYDSINGDRKYSGRQLMEVFDGIISDGVISGYKNSLAVTKSGSNVLVGTGRAWFNGTWTFNSAALSLAITAASTTNGRCDIVGIQINQNTRVNSFFYRAGTPSSNYQNLDGAPTPVQTGGIYEYILAYVLVPTTGAANATIVDARGTGRTGAAPYASVYGISDDTYVPIDFESYQAGSSGYMIGVNDSGKVKKSNLLWREANQLSGIRLDTTVQTQLNNLVLADKGVAHILISGSTTLNANHAGRMLLYNSTSAATVTIPAESPTIFPMGTEILFAVYNTGLLTIAPASSVRLLAIDGQTTNGQSAIKIPDRYGVCGIKKVHATMWLAFGDYEIA